MELKKNPAKDLNKKKTAFFFIGLTISLSLIFAAFNIPNVEKEVIVDLPAMAMGEEEEILDIPPTIQQPPPPPKIQQPEIKEVPDEEEIEEEVEVELESEMEETAPVEVVEPVDVGGEVEEEQVEEIFRIVEDPATFPGGLKEFFKYVQRNLQYPEQAKRMGIEGKVFVEFVVGKDGSIMDVKAVKGIGGGCDEEAVKIIKSSPKWSPPKQRGRPVKQRMVLPIRFKLG